MAEIWWTCDRAAQYVLAHYPCDDYPCNDIIDARHLLAGKVADGVLSVWCRIGDGPRMPIDKGEWRRAPGRYLEWEGAQRLQGGGDVVVYEIEATAVQRLCAPQPEPKGPGGRRRVSEWDLFLFEVVALALRPDGLPQTQADLRHYMIEWCSDPTNMREPLGDDAIEKKVRSLYQFLDARGITPAGERLR
jgi:hypothetical protein